MSRAAVRELDPYQAGTSIEEVKQRFGLDRIVKLASNENPLGSSPKALAALGHLDRLHLYFDDAHTELKEKIASRYALGAQHVVLGNGSNDLIGLIAATMLDPADEAVMALPSFALYRLAVTLRGAIPVEVALRAGVHDLDAMLSAIGARTKLCFICDPNNPTGTALSAAAWRTFLTKVPPHVTLVIDQAYREYMSAEYPETVDFVTMRPKTIVLRTMSKIYGLASLRFGYGLADPETVGWLDRVRLPFNVSRPAALAAWSALDDVEFVQRSLAVNAEGKSALSGAFERLGCAFHATQANFIAVQVPGGAAAAYEDLLTRGIIVRSGDGLRFPGWLRITIGTGSENALLIAAIEELLPSWRARR